MKKIPYESTEMYKNRTLNTDKLKIGVLLDETISNNDNEPSETLVS